MEELLVIFIIVFSPLFEWRVTYRYVISSSNFFGEYLDSQDKCVMKCHNICRQISSQKFILEDRKFSYMEDSVF